MKLEDAISMLKTYIENHPERKEEEREVIIKFGTTFNPDNLDRLTKEDFKSFLLFKHNKHWDGIHRQGNVITNDMQKLRQALKILLDEKIDIRKRLERLFPGNRPNYIKGLGRAIVTPILMVVYPRKYGVYNKKSEAGLRELGLHSKYKGKSFAERYVSINSILTDLAQRYNITLFQLDDMFGLMYQSTGVDVEDVQETPSVENLASFGLEKHLEDFLVNNWEKTSLGRLLDIYEEDGDLAQQYHTPVGPIDILARDKRTKDWVVIELKKGKESDKVIGQTLRYIGWIQQNKAQRGYKVRGIIIAGEEDEGIKHALKPVSNIIKFLTYKVTFSLKEGFRD